MLGGPLPFDTLVDCSSSWASSSDTSYQVALSSFHCPAPKGASLFNIMYVHFIVNLYLSCSSFMLEPMCNESCVGGGQNIHVFSSGHLSGYLRSLAIKTIYGSSIKYTGTLPLSIDGHYVFLSIVYIWWAPMNNILSQQHFTYWGSYHDCIMCFCGSIYWLLIKLISPYCAVHPGEGCYIVDDCAYHQAPFYYYSEAFIMAF